MRYALIRNGVVENAVISDSADMFEAMGFVVVASETASPLDVWDGTTFSRPPPTPEQVIEAKAAKLASIAKRTEELHARGFEYPPGSGSFYTLAAEARVRTLTAFVAKDLGAPAMRYPVVWFNNDRTAFQYLANADDVTSWLVRLGNADRDQLEAAIPLEIAVANAETIEDVEAVRDGR